MRSIILSYNSPTRKLDVLTQNPKVKQYFYNIGYVVGFEWGWSFPEVSSYNDIFEEHLWLGKLLLNIPVANTVFTDNNSEIRYSWAAWISGRSFPMPT